jgi:hypothetical protein
MYCTMYCNSRPNPRIPYPLSYTLGHQSIKYTRVKDPDSVTLWIRIRKKIILLQKRYKIALTTVLFENKIDE